MLTTEITLLQQDMSDRMCLPMWQNISSHLMLISENNKPAMRNRKSIPILLTFLIYRQFSHTSPRTLLAIIRMAQAVARLNFRELVEIADVDEALRLIKAAKASLNDHNGPTGRDTSRSTQIYEILRQINETSEDGEMAIDEIRRRVTGRGFTEEDMWKAIQEYEELGVMITTGGNTRVRFVVLDENASDMEID